MVIIAINNFVHAEMFTQAGLWSKKEDPDSITSGMEELSLVPKRSSGLAAFLHGLSCPRRAGADVRAHESVREAGSMLGQKCPCSQVLQNSLFCPPTLVDAGLQDSVHVRCSLKSHWSIA